MLVLLCAALVQKPTRASQGLDEDVRSSRALAWLRDSVPAREPPSGPLDAARVADLFCLLPLASTASDSDTLRAWRVALRSLQEPDGHLPAGARTREVTGYAALLWELSHHALEREAAERARAFLRRSVVAPSPPAGDASVGRALSFLARRRTPELFSGERFRIDEYAGARLSVREARAHLAYGLGDDAGALTASFLLPSRGGLPQDVHLAARVLADGQRHRLAETPTWVAELKTILDGCWDEDAGAWSPRPGGSATPAATAAGLLASSLLSGRRRGLSAEELIAADASEPREFAVLEADCLGCHETLAPTQVALWRDGPHGQAQVGCADCHGVNHSTIFRSRGGVPPSVCGECHVDEAREFSESRHATAEETLLASVLFQSTPVPARAACIRCHDIGRRWSDGSRGNCNHCHVGHGGRAEWARAPEACTGCHTGEDYPQDHAWGTSPHGALYRLLRDETRAPTCATCHHPDGEHGTSFGITVGGSGAGATRAGDPVPYPLPVREEADLERARDEMVGVCARCHASRLVRDDLQGADDLKRYTDGVLADAAAILRELHDEGLLGAGPLELGPDQPPPGSETRPGSALLDRYYHMRRFRAAHAWKGAYHSSPSVANLESRLGLEVDLEWLRRAAADLREEDRRRR